MNYPPDRGRLWVNLYKSTMLHNVGFSSNAGRKVSLHSGEPLLRAITETQCYAARSMRMSISLRSVPKSIGLVSSASAPFSKALRFVSASP